MPEIYPKVTRAKLKKSARKTSEGKGRAPLPGARHRGGHPRGHLGGRKRVGRTGIGEASGERRQDDRHGDPELR